MSDASAENRTSAVRASLTAVAGVMGAVGLLLLLVTWAATIGPQQVVTDEGNPPTNMSPPPSVFTASASPNTGGGRPEGGGDHDVLFTVVAIVATLFATILMLALVLTVLRWLLTRTWRRQREPEPDEVEFDPLDAPAALADAMVAGAARQRELLASGSPRNAIVECWLRFEESAGAVGVRRLPWETSSEFTLRVLDGLSADARAVSELAELYRDARYSRHEITEDNRHQAQVALDVIHRSLGVRAGAS